MGSRTSAVVVLSPEKTPRPRGADQATWGRSWHEEWTPPDAFRASSGITPIPAPCTVPFVPAAPVPPLAFPLPTPFSQLDPIAPTATPLDPDLTHTVGPIDVLSRWRPGRRLLLLLRWRPSVPVIVVAAASASSAFHVIPQLHLHPEAYSNQPPTTVAAAACRCRGGGDGSTLHVIGTGPTAFARSSRSPVNHRPSIKVRRD